MVKGQERSVASQRRAFALRPHAGPRPSTRDSRPSRGGFTLIELLVTILIISILAGLVLGVAALAGEKAREAQTRHVVARLHNLLMDRYNTYKSRRVRLNSDIERQIMEEGWQSPAQQGQAFAEARLYALREMMLMELPDRWSDVVLDAVGNSEKAPLYLIGRTDLSNVYLRRYKSLIGRTNALTGAANTAGDIKENQSAECLYLVITLATGDGEARGLFGESSIGDTDGDGAPEFLDGWGHPIRFLRWAPGFDSLIQLNLNVLEGLDPQVANSQVAEDHDPFDLFRRELIAFRLVPLIYSAGRDEELGINSLPDFVTWRVSSSSSLSFNNSPPLVTPQLTPYRKGPPSWPAPYLGMDLGEGTSTDNVHNHLIGQR